MIFQMWVVWVYHAKIYCKNLGDTLRQVPWNALCGRWNNETSWIFTVIRATRQIDLKVQHQLIISVTENTPSGEYQKMCMIVTTSSLYISHANYAEYLDKILIDLWHVP